MRRALVVLLTTAVLSACGGDGGGGGSEDQGEPQAQQPTEAPDESVRVLTEQELKSALVTLKDLPAGYTAGEVTEDEDDTDISGANAECTARFRALEDDEEDEEAKAEAAFEAPDGSSSLEVSLESHADAEALSQDLTDVRETFEKCDTLRIAVDASTTAELTVKEASFPELGDESVAYRAEGEVQGFQLGLLFVFVRVANTGQSIFAGGLGTPDVAAVEKAARAGTQRLEELLAS